MISFEDKILDNVHGFIELTHVECRIIELPLFRRLRQLKQLSLADWIFPGAEHTRYIHSLGVMHVADKIALKLHFKDEDRQTVRLAGLLHDLGHYPLSHVGEAAYMNDRIVEDLIEEQRKKVKEKIEIISQDRLEDYMKSSSNPKHHERITEKVILSDDSLGKIIEEECSYIDIQDICDIITGCVDRKKELSVKVQIMHSELDADRIDYILRDATFSGTSFGGFELDMLLDNLKIASYKGVDIVGIQPKGIPSADQFLVNRYFSYSQIIYNKHVEILGFMAQTWIEHCIKRGWMTKKSDFENIVKNHNISRDYLNQTDTMFWSTLNKVKEVQEDEYIPGYIKKIAQALADYSELEYIPESEIRIISPNPEEVKKIFEEMTLSDHTLPIMEICSITKHIPEEEYISKLRKRRDQESDSLEEEELEPSLVHRMQDGLTVVQEDLSVHLLVDDKRSLISSLYKNKLYLYREYTIL